MIVIMNHISYCQLCCENLILVCDSRVIVSIKANAGNRVLEFIKTIWSKQKTHFAFVDFIAEAVASESTRRWGKLFLCNIRGILWIYFLAISKCYRIFKALFSLTLYEPKRSRIILALAIRSTKYFPAYVSYFFLFVCYRGFASMFKLM